MPVGETRARSSRYAKTTLRKDNRLNIRPLVTNARAAEALGIDAETLRQVDRRKDEFLGILAHELGNPLPPMRFAIELMRRVGRDADHPMPSFATRFMVCDSLASSTPRKPDRMSALPQVSKPGSADHPPPCPS